MLLGINDSLDRGSELKIHVLVLILFYDLSVIGHILIILFNCHYSNELGLPINNYKFININYEDLSSITQLE